MDKLVEYARDLRKKQTDAERKLWNYLRGRRFFNLKFKRQEPVGKYIADFICYEKSIIIELDGGQHAEKAGNDKIRDNYLRGCGYIVLRFWDNDALKYTESILEVVRQEIFV